MKIIKNIDENLFKAWTEKTRERAKALQEMANGAAPVVHISEGVSKLKNGEVNIPAWSLLPFVTCRNARACGNLCYVNGILSRYPNVAKTWAENTAAAMDGSFEKTVSAWVAWNRPRYFRIHVSGDFFSLDYFKAWVRIARKNRGTKFLAFSKSFDIIRAFLAEGGRIPKNLSVLLSVWPTMEEPSDLMDRFPVSRALRPTDAQVPGAIPCTGNCAACLGCWALSAGGVVTFPIHY